MGLLLVQLCLKMVGMASFLNLLRRPLHAADGGTTKQIQSEVVGCSSLRGSVWSALFTVTNHWDLKSGCYGYGYNRNLFSDFVAQRGAQQPTMWSKWKVKSKYSTPNIQISSFWERHLIYSVYERISYYELRLVIARSASQVNYILSPYPPSTALGVDWPLSRIGNILNSNWLLQL